MRQIKVNYIIILISLIILLMLLLWISYTEYKVMQVIYYDTYGIVGNSIGFDTNAERIAFGMILPGGGSTRELTIENGPIAKTGYIYINGDIAPLINVRESPFEINPYENKTLVFIMSAPIGQEKEVYTGEFKIVLKGKR